MSCYKMDPWQLGQSQEKGVEINKESGKNFEDNFKPTVGDCLGDSEQYLAALGKIFML